MFTKKNLLKTLASLVIVALSLVLIFLVSTSDVTKPLNGTSSAPYLQLNEDIKVSTESYYDGTKIFKLPDTVKSTDLISVIVKSEQEALYDAYTSAKLDITFQQYLKTEQAQSVRDKIEAENEQLKSVIEGTGVSYELGMKYDTLLSGFEIIIKAEDFEATAKAIDGKATAIVGEVYEPAKTELVENKVNVYETGIFDSSDFEYDGTGMTVAVLDTGLDYTHTAFKNFSVPSDKLGLTFNDVVGLLNARDFVAENLQNGLTASDVYINDKVPFAFDYADGDSDVFPINSDHGTHVAGIIAGKDDTITGVAPNAQLIIMKTFSDTESSARTAWILGALEDCVTLNVDVINMSLGTDCGFSRPTDKENVNNIYERIKAAGISLVVAASNSYNSTYGSEKNGNLGLTSNPDSATVGSPSTYDAALSIASISGVKTPYLIFNDNIIYFNESTDRVAEEKDFILDVLGAGTKEAEIELVVIPGVGRMADYTGVDVTGKIVLVRRGDSTFEEKANIAQQKGAKGIIVYNNVSGDIKMNVGEATLGAVSISQADGELLAASGGGIIKVSTTQVSGPFMSDFSSWGPTPSLGIKPELTAHGGSILSAVPGQDYDRISGTSMATPNMSGVVILLRQYVKQNFPELADDNQKVAALVNCLLMSTADIINNKNGLPYSVRKQGAGLANLISAATTSAYVITYDKDGNEMDKTKFELGDDAEKAGVYTLDFAIKNFGNTSLTYDLDVITMTEGVSDTKTSHGETTVTESGYMLYPTVTLVSVENGEQADGKVTVAAGKTATVKVTITLSDADKKYLDDSFKNGMYVEGFLRLVNTDENGVDLGAPFLAFYGDWTKAPIFDLDYYATNKDELDDGIDLEDKTLPDAYATRPIGSVEGDYVNYMGSFYFEQNPAQTPIAADRKYISISNQVGSVHSLEYVWAGLLRNCDRIEVTITEDATGEVVFETVDYDVRKSYSNGQTIYPANVDIGFDAAEQNLKNNTKYTVTLKSFLDYERDGSETNANNTFTFPLVTDFSAPAVTGVEYYTEYDKSTKETRLFAKIAIYDNHYVMGTQVGYVGIQYDAAAGVNTLMLQAFDQYVNAVYSEFNTTNYITYELTDYVQEIKKNAYHKNTFTVAVYDYALNQATYEIGLPDEFTDFYFDLGTDEEGNAVNTLELSPNQTYVLDPKVYPTTEWVQLLNYKSDNESIARIVNNKLLAIAPGETTIRAQLLDPETGKVVKEAAFTLAVQAEYILDEEGKYIKNEDGEFKLASADDEGERYSKNSKFKRVSKPVVDEFYLTGYYVDKAFYFLSSTDRDIGETGNEMKFNGSYYGLEMFPSEAVTIRYILDAYFPDATTIEFKSNDDQIVSVDANGKIVAKAEGYASVTVKVLQDGKSTYYSQTIDITVKEPYVTSGPMLANYYGNGGYVTIPDDLAITEIGQFAFSNYTYIPKEEWEIDPDSNETYKLWYIGEDTIQTVVIPEGVEKIGAYAFANLTALEEVVLPSTLKMIDQGAFYGCTKLKSITGLEHVKFINQNAFYGCSLSGEMNLESAVAIGNYAFGMNGSKYGQQSSGLTSVILSEKTQSIGAYAFYGCDKLEEITINAETVQLGMGAFADCSSLKSISINAPVIPTGTFDGCRSLSSVTLGKDVKEIGEYAFSNTALKSFTVDSENTAMKTVSGKPYILNKEGNTLVLFPSGVEGAVTIDDSNIKTVGKGAFAGCTRLTSVSIPSATAVKDYAFAGCTRLSTISLGNLTEIGSYAFHRTSIVVAHSFASLTSIGDYAYAETKLIRASIPDGVTVGVGAFQDCKELVYVTVGNNVTLKDSAFRTNNLSYGNYDTVEKNDDGKTYYEYVYFSKLTNIIIGENVTIGNGAFYGAVSVVEITLGEGAVIGNQAFYNTNSLTTIDLSKVISIGDDAFSGDVMYQLVEGVDPETGLAALVPRTDKNGAYIYSYFAPDFTEITLTNLESLGQRAFSYCMALNRVILGDKVTAIKERAFASCEALEEINLGNVVTIGAEAFAETALKSVDLSSATEIGQYAFVFCEDLTSVTLNENGSKVYEGAFSYCSKLESVENLSKVTQIDSYAFAYTALTNLDLSAAEYIGDYAFLKEEVTSVTIKLGDLKDIGENPFAMCRMDKFTTIVKESFNGTEYDVLTSNYDISDIVKVIDGSIYRVVPNGYELITYAGNDKSYTVADGTVRISAYALAGSEIEAITFPLTVKSIGHKAMYGCESLKVVVFTSLEAPVLEEEYDYSYFSSYQNFPATGEYTDFTDYEGNTVIIKGLEIVDFFMYNVASFPTNIYYGANFVDYVGHVDNKIVMTKPNNGKNYDSFIFNQYFALAIDGETAPEEATLKAISAILSIPDKDSIKLEHKSIVEAARAAYSLVTSLTQQGIIKDQGYYDILTAAENKIADLEYVNNKPSDGPSDDQPGDEPGTDDPSDTTEEPENDISVFGIVILCVLAALALVGYMIPVYIYVIKPKMLKKKAEQSDKPQEASEEQASTNDEASDASDNE